MEVSTCWLETHHEIVASITLARESSNPPPAIEIMNEMEGTGGFWEWAVELTNEFEALHKDTEWDGEFFEELETFLTQKFNEQ